MPYDEHLLTDFGGALLGQAAVLALAAWWLERRVVLLSAALLAYTATAARSRPTAGSVAHSAPSQDSP